MQNKLKHNTEILSPYKVCVTCLLTITYVYIQQTQTNISLHLEPCFWPPDKGSTSVHSPFTLLLLPLKLLRKKSVLYTHTTVFTS